MGKAIRMAQYGECGWYFLSIYHTYALGREDLFLLVMYNTHRCIGLCWLIMISLASYGQQVTKDKIEFVVQPYVQRVEESTFHVLWETSRPSVGGVWLAEMEYNVVKPDLVLSARESGQSLMHNLQVKGLKKGEPYLYQVMSITPQQDTLWGPLTAFTIPDYTRQAVTFTVVGDTQGNPYVWGKIAGLMYQERPSFIVHVGDLVQYGPHKDDWTDEFFKPAADILKHYPLYPTIGNHEMNHPFYYQYFHLPEPEWFYTAVKGNVLFVFVDTNKEVLPGSEQYRKLEKVLASSRQEWKIVVHHHPVYVSFQDTGYMKLPYGDENIMHLKNLYEDYGVDLVLNGHIHQYERTEPIYRGKINRSKGVVYLSTGGGGGTLDDPASAKKWYDVRTRKLHHFVTFNIWENTLQAQSIDSSGKVFDGWEVIKPATTSNPLLMTSHKPSFSDSTLIQLQNLAGSGTIVYRIKGQAKEQVSREDKVQIPVFKTTEITAWIRDAKGNDGRPVTKTYSKVALFGALKGVNNPKVTSDYYEGFYTRLPDFTTSKPLRSFVSDSLTLATIIPRRKDHWAARFKGYFTVADTDVYRLLLQSYDGSKLWIDGREIIDNDGFHYEIYRDGCVGLEKGVHSFEIQFFDFTRRETLELRMGKQNKEMVDFNSYLMR